MKLVGVERRKETKVTYVANVLLPVAGVVAIVAFTITVFCQEAYSSHLSKPIEVFCTANGDPRVVTQGQTSRLVSPHWDPSLFLSITFGFGHFTYAAAKGIDICWDLMVGRGGQILLALSAYPVLRRSLLRCMEQRPVDFSVYSSLAFDKVSIAALWATTCSLFGNKQLQQESLDDQCKRKLSWHFDWRYLGHFVVLIYILGFSTLVSVMTGYQSAFTPYVRRSDNHTLTELSQLDIPNFVIIDGGRIGLKDYQPIDPGDPKNADIRGYAEKIYANLDHNLVDCFAPHTTSTIPCDLEVADPNSTYCGFVMLCGEPVARPGEPLPSADKSHAILEAGVLSSSNITIGGKTWVLEAPPLDIVAQPQTPLYGADTPRSYPRENYMSLGDSSFSSAYLRENVVCQPAAYYQWGFSSLLLLVFCLLTIIFAIVLTWLHEDVFWKSKADRFQYDINHYRDAVDLVTEFEKNQLPIQHMSARAIKNKVHQSSNGGICLDSHELPCSRSEEGIRLRQPRRSHEDQVSS